MAEMAGYPSTLGPDQLRAALVDLCLRDQVVVEGRVHAVQVYIAAAALDLPVCLPRTGDGVWTVEAG